MQFRAIRKSIEYIGSYFDGQGVRDGRKAFWVAGPGVAKQMRACFRSDAALFLAWKTNSKTGGNILNGHPVRPDVLQAAIDNFLDLLVEIAEGRAVEDRIHKRAIMKAIEAYASPRVEWDELAHDIEAAGRDADVESDEVQRRRA